MATISPPISPAHAVVYTPANFLLSVGVDRTVERTLGRLPTAIAGELDSLDVSPDGQHVLVGVVNESANTLWHWDGHQLPPVPVAALVTSG